MASDNPQDGSRSVGPGGSGLPSSSRVVRWVLDLLLGESLELTIDSRRFRLTQERVYRLESLDSGFVFFMGSSTALERRLETLAGGTLRGIRAFPCRPRGNHILN